MGKNKNIALYLKEISEDPENSIYAEFRDPENRDKEMTDSEKKEMTLTI